MKMIGMREFYMIAGVLMGIAFLANLWTLIAQWDLMILPGKIAFIFGTLLFNLLLSVLFIGMLKFTPKADVTIDNKELDNLLTEYSKKEKTQKGGNKNVWKETTATTS